MRYLLFENETPRMEFSLGFVAFLFGGWLLLPAETFEISPTYIAMKQLAPEFLWGFAFVILGGFQMHFSTDFVRSGKPHLILFKDLSKKYGFPLVRILTVRIRLFITRISVVLWIFTAVMFLIFNLWAAETILYSAIAFVSASVTFTLGRRV